jgi:WD40 repeat protein
MSLPVSRSRRVFIGGGDQTMQTRFGNGDVRGWGLTAAVGLVAAFAAGCGNLAEVGPNKVAYAPNGELIVFLNGETRFFDADAQHALGSIQTPTQIGGVAPGSARFAASSDGTTVATGVDGTVEVYSVGQRKKVASIIVEPDPRVGRPIVGITLSPHGDLVAVSMHPSWYLEEPLPEAPSLTIWRVADQTRVAAVAAPADRPKWTWLSGLAFSPDASTLYGRGADWTDVSPAKFTVSAWNAETGDLIWETESGTQDVDYGISLALSSDGSMVATADTTIHLWRASDGSPLPFDGTLEPGSALLAMSPDGQDFAVAHWSPPSPGMQVIGPDGAGIWRTPVDPSPYGCHFGVFSLDGMRVAAACDLDLKIWDVQTGALIRDLKVAGPIY